jgi:3-hydroxyacyl-[acyl-carrier-protein] dehydratase
MSRSDISNLRQLDFEEIKGIIPQRFPFLMLDRVVESDPGVRTVGLKNLTGNEWFYQGHFPKKAVTPGAMICEAIAQTGIIFFSVARPQLRDVTYLLGGLKIRFLKPVWPGDQLIIDVTPLKLTKESGILNAVVTVDKIAVAKGAFMLTAKSNEFIT